MDFQAKGADNESALMYGFLDEQTNVFYVV
jgi:hypothetical protein